MPTPGKLEFTIDVNQLPANVKTTESGWKQFEVKFSEQTVTLTLKPKVFEQLEQAQQNCPQGVIKIVGQIGLKTPEGFLLKDCDVHVYAQSDRSSQSVTTSSNSALKNSPSEANNSFTAKYRLYTGDNLNLLQVIFQLEKSIFPSIFPWLLFFGAYGFLITFLYGIGLPLTFPEESDAITRAVLIFNIGLPLLLVFRTNTAHQRFWEARQFWGSLINTTRNLTRSIWIVIQEQSPQDRVEKEANIKLVAAFAIAMKLHLRAEPVNEELASLMSETLYFKLKYTNHPPLQIAFWIGDYLQQQYRRSSVDVYQLSALHKLLDRLVDILGGCERILKTPLPLVYPLILRKLVFVYCLILPFEIVKEWTWVTSSITTFVSFILLSVDQIGSEIEEPFGHNLNDLPLDPICNTIKRDVEDLISLSPGSNSSYRE